MRRALKNAGVYCIANTIDEKVYIGSTVDLKRRWREHKRMLERDQHSNIKLQRAWNKYGSEVFVFSVLEYETDPDKLLEAEQRWMNWFQAFKRGKGYNINPSAHSFAAVWQNPQTRAAQSERVKRLWQDQVLREKYITALRAVWTEERRQEASRLGKLKCQDPQHKETLINIALLGRLAMSATPESRQSVADKKRQTWRKGNQDALQAERVRRFWQNTAYRNRQSISRKRSLQQMQSDTAQWQASVQKRAEALRQPETRASISDAVKRLWQDPEYRAKMKAGRSGKRRTRKYQTPECPYCSSEDTCSRGRYDGDRWRMKCLTCGKSSILETSPVLNW